MRKLVVAPMVFLVLFVMAAPARAITNGAVDGTRHPNVAVVVAEWRNPGVKDSLCTGTLIAPRIVLTAGHCTDFLENDLGISPDQIWVSFDPAFTASSTLYRGTWHTDPAYRKNGSDPHDLAAIVLGEPITSITPARLPAAGLFDRMKDDGTIKGQTFTAVGYGVDEKSRTHGPGTYPDDNVRKFATSSFNSLNNAWLRLSMNSSHGDGGTCYGDSGGPNFLGTSDTIAATTVTGDTPCYSTNVDYRLDTQSARAFLGQYVTLP